MKKKKLIITLIILIIIIAILIIGYKTILAFYTSKDQTINKFSVGQISATVTEPNYENNKIIKPNEEIAKDPTLSNTGEVDSYIRAQVYVPISSEIKYVDLNENIVTPSEETEIFTYKVNDGWEEVTDDGFFGIYEDKDGNKYKVHTYKYVKNGQEQIIKPGETIGVTVFDKVKVINYVDMDKNVNLKLYVSAIAVQSDGGTAEEMWTYYKNQNGSGILGVD